MNAGQLNLHDALIERADLGPRRELRISVLIPEVTTATMYHRRQRVSIRFNAIANYVEVTSFFDGLEQRRGGAQVLDETMGFEELRGGWLLELDHSGENYVQTAKAPVVEWGDWLTSDRR